MAIRKISPLQRFLYILEFIIVVPIANLISILPWKAGYKVADFLGKVLYRIDSRDRKIAYQNLDVIYKEKPLSNEEKDVIIKKVFHNTVRMGFEFLKRGYINKNNYQQFVRVEGLENIDKGCSAGKGLIIITAHMGNFEYLGDIPMKLGYKAGVLINRQFNPYTDVWIKNFRQNKGGMVNFYNEIGDLVKLLKFIKKGGIVAMVVDQTHYFKPIFVPFFGVQSATADGPARLHFQLGSPILMAFCVMQDDGKYLLKYEEPVTFEKTGDIEADCKTVMTWVNSKFEEYVRKYPDQWFSLLHGRWERTKPEDFNDQEAAPF